jgi:hypothetical protein
VVSALITDYLKVTYERISHLIIEGRWFSSLTPKVDLYLLHTTEFA